MAVSLNGGTPHFTPQVLIIFRKTHGPVGETHHFLVQPPNDGGLGALASGEKMDVSLPERCREGDTLCLLQRHDETWKVELEGWGK